MMTGISPDFYGLLNMRNLTANSKCIDSQLSYLDLVAHRLCYVAAVLNLHLSKTSSPVASDMKQNIYVDNILPGCYTEAGTMKY